jgi:hypothetical protein
MGFEVSFARGFSVEQKSVKPAPGKPEQGTMQLKNSRRATPVDPQSTNSKEPVALRLS